MNIYLKWILIVGLNSIAGFIWGNQIISGYQHWLGMLAGVLTWYGIYVMLDRSLIKNGLTEISKKLTISASIRIMTQITIYPEMLAGIVAFSIVEALAPASREGDFLHSYALTFFTGFILSLLCAILFLLVSLGFYLRKRWRPSAAPSRWASPAAQYLISWIKTWTR